MHQSQVHHIMISYSFWILQPLHHCFCWESNHQHTSILTSFQYLSSLVLDVNYMFYITFRESQMHQKWVYIFDCSKHEDRLSFHKGQNGGTEAPAFAGSGKGSHHLVYCTQPYPVFTQEAVSRTWTCDLTVTWQQLYLLRQGYPSPAFIP